MDLAQLFQSLPDAVYVVDPATARILACNENGHARLGYTAEQLLTMRVQDLQTDVSGAAHWRSIAAAIRQHSPYLFIGHHRCADGRLLPVEISTRVLWQQGRELFVSVARDISNRIEQLCAGCGDSSDCWIGLHDAADGCWEWRPPEGRVYFSPGLKRLLGYGPDELQPDLASWQGSIHPEDAPLVLSALHEHLAGRRHQFRAEYRLRNRNGHFLWVRDCARVQQRDAAGNAARVVGLLHNITDLKLQELDLQQQADFDALTGLLNRRRGEALAEQLIALMQRQHRPLGFAVLDLDNFKQINDLHGHLAGDEVLRTLADFIGGFVRRSDLLFRWGGEEFVLLCPDTDAAGMRRLMQQLRRGIACLEWQGVLQGHRVTTSIGVSMFPADADDQVRLMAQADSALYAAKREGKDRVVFFADTSAAVGGGAQPDGSILTR